MRVSFIEPSPEEFAIYFDNNILKRGGGLDDIAVFSSPRRGCNSAGLFSIVSGLVKRVAPVVSRAIMPSALEFGQNVLQDLQSGKTNLKGALKERGLEALKNTGRRILTGQGARKRKRRNMTKSKNKRLKKKRNKKPRTMAAYKDVFDVL